MHKVLLLAGLLTAGMSLNAQILIDDEMIIFGDSLTLGVGMELEIGEPSTEQGEYAYIIEQLGFSKVLNDVKDSKLSQYGVKTKEMSLKGETMKIKKIKRKGNKRTGYKFFMIMQLANRTFKASLPQAIKEKEIVIK